jgi:hypothetical protein
VVRSVDWIRIYHWGAGLAVTLQKRLTILFSKEKQQQQQQQ